MESCGRKREMGRVSSQRRWWPGQECEQLPSFTQRLIPWQTWLIQSLWITDSRMLCSLPKSCVVHPVDRFDSEGWFSSDQVIFLKLCFVFLVKKRAAFKWKDAISGFPVSPDSAEALARWGGKIKYVLIAYFLGNTFAKKCCNRVCKDYSKSKVGRFLRRNVRYTMWRHRSEKNKTISFLSGFVWPFFFLE